MSCPREIDVQKIYKISRFLKSFPLLKHVYYTSNDTRYVDVFVDSDSAGDEISRKSTTGVVIKYGGYTVKTYSRNQKTIALSSAEAELYAIVSGVSEALGIQSSWPIWAKRSR